MQRERSGNDGQEWKANECKERKGKEMKGSKKIE